ncbi:MAG TPA: hypothetical protein VJP89_08020, partial [Pyrinomonadaceae bacterium]|nr:hypothetical protein [Pyrinomonadaceae bacterium]
MKKVGPLLLLRGYELHATVPQLGNRFAPVLAQASSKDTKSREYTSPGVAGFLTSVETNPHRTT